MLANVADISHLWIPTSLLGLAHGSLFSLYPTICLEWFGMRAYFVFLSVIISLLISWSAHFSENWGYLGMSVLAGGNLFSLTFGRNLDHNIPHKHSGSPPSPPTHELAQCLQGLDCYVHAIYLTVGATFLSILLCVWAGYKEKQKKSTLHVSRTKLARWYSRMQSFHSLPYADEALLD